MDDHNELRKPIKDLVQYELSEQQLIHIESCLKDIEPAINYLRRTNFSDTTKGSKLALLPLFYKPLLGDAFIR